MIGIKSENLISMLDFFYGGKANVCQENLEDFLALADEMKLKGLSRLEESEETLDSNQFKRVPQQTSEPDLLLRYRREQNKIDLTETQLDSTLVSEKTVALNNSVELEVADMQQLSDQITYMMEMGENRV